MNLPNFYTDDIIRRALEEDINYIDLATDSHLDDEDVSTASFIAKAEGVLCGIDIALRVFTLIDSNVKTEIRIKDGGKVNKGDVIASVGSTGWSTGPHLHFEIRKDGSRVDPLNYVNVP